MDASYKIQRGIHVHLIQFFMCPEFWVHIIFLIIGDFFIIFLLLYIDVVIIVYFFLFKRYSM